MQGSIHCVSMATERTSPSLSLCMCVRVFLSLFFFSYYHHTLTKANPNSCAIAAYLPSASQAYNSPPSPISRPRPISASASKTLFVRRGPTVTTLLKKKKNHSPDLELTGKSYLAIFADALWDRAIGSHGPWSPGELCSLGMLLVPARSHLLGASLSPVGLVSTVQKWCET